MTSVNHPRMKRTVLDNALSAVEREHAWLGAEIQAFTALRDQIETIQPQADHQSVNHQPSGLSPQVAVSTSSEPFAQVRDAYRDTIFAVDHWTDAYGEQTVADSIANEFSPAVADVLCNPNGVRFTPVIVTKVIAEIENAIAQRQASRDVLATEQTKLETLASELIEVCDLLQPLVEHDEAFADRRLRLTTALTTLEELAETHQAYIHNRSLEADQLLVGMVYRELATSYPGLSAIATVRRAVNRVNHHFWAGYI